MLASLSKFILEFFGWSIIGQPPTNEKYVIIIAPHTSNWDFFIFILMKFTFQLKVVFIGKHTIFIGPVGWLLRKMGGLPVDRSRAHNVVDTIVDEFNKRENMIFALSPEGTRSYLPNWKSGFYHIARKANIPVQSAFLNMTNKTIGWGPLFELSDDKYSDLERMKQFYQDKKGFKPEKFSKIVFLSSKS
ncbi:MAG: lysophospholipid acyltransferase family protein [Kangiellaceae bacterium]|nr:lysophospholipid acyltransferase family protein [Kangiellaceae bacterium]